MLLICSWVKSHRCLLAVNWEGMGREEEPAVSRFYTGRAHAGANPFLPSTPLPLADPGSPRARELDEVTQNFRIKKDLTDFSTIIFLWVKSSPDPHYMKQR